MDSNPLRTYFEQESKVFTTGLAGQITDSIVIFLKSDIRGFDIILGQPWLKQIALSIN